MYSLLSLTYDYRQLEKNMSNKFVKLLVKNIRVCNPVSASEVMSDTCHTDITVKSVAKFFNVGLDRARDIIQTTTQRRIRRAIHPLMKRYRALVHVHKR